MQRPHHKSQFGLIIETFFTFVCQSKTISTNILALGVGGYTVLNINDKSGKKQVEELAKFSPNHLVSYFSEFVN